MVSLSCALRRALYQLGVYCRVRMHRGGCGGHWGARTGGVGARAASRESAMAARLTAFVRSADFELIFLEAFFAI